MSQHLKGQKFSAVLIRMPVEMHEAIKARAVEEDRNMAQVVRRALRLYLAAGPPDEEEHPLRDEERCGWNDHRVRCARPVHHEGAHDFGAGSTDD